jgi:protein kinase C substrate 80K-H
VEELDEDFDQDDDELNLSDDYDEDYDYDRDEDYNYNEDKYVPNHVHPDEIDEETQKIFDLATEAKDNFSKINRKYTDIENEVSDIKDREHIDFGDNDVYLTMYKECYELKTAEYIYKVSEKIFIYKNKNVLSHSIVRG